MILKYLQLGFESFKYKRYYRKLCLFQTVNTQLTNYLFQIVSLLKSRYHTRNSENFYQGSRKHDLLFIQPKPNSVIIPINFKGTRRIIRLRIGLTHLPEHKFKHSFSSVSTFKFFSSYFTALPMIL